MTAKTFSKVLVLSCSLFFLLLPPASARGRGGAVFIGGGFGGFGGFYDPFWGSYPYYPMYDQGPAVGTVKFDTADKSAAVYIEGGYAGTVGDLKNLRLQPGTYNIELRPANSPTYTAKIYVGAGKTVHVNPSQRP
jgi:hypothetical protein